MKLHTLIGCFACVLGLSTLAHAQAVPTATRSTHIQVGAGFNYARSDYGQSIKGLTVYGDYDFVRNLGIEGDLHFVNIITPGDVGEKSYLIGPRYRFSLSPLYPLCQSTLRDRPIPISVPQLWISQHDLHVWGLCFGRGSGHACHQAPEHSGPSMWRFPESWPSFQDHGLSPIVLTFGAAYSF